MPPFRSTPGLMPDGGLIPLYWPAEVGGGIVQSQLHIGDHLCRTPHVLSDSATDWLALTVPEKSPAFVVRKWGRRNSAAMWHLLGKRAVRNQVVLSAAYTMTGLFVTGSLN
jgi:hypothetical protein